jgi:hypothetical protein
VLVGMDTAGSIICSVPVINSRVRQPEPLAGQILASRRECKPDVAETKAANW